ncbi:MAG: CBS domain-containing protein [Myxococcales bacterium]
MFDFDVRSGNNRPVDEPRGGGPARGEETDVALDAISTLPRRSPLVVGPLVSLRSALGLMAGRQVAAALVASHGVLLGILNERDLAHRLLEPDAEDGQLAVWRVMNPNTETLLDTDSVAYATTKLWARGGRAMPVLRSDGMLHGLLETQDIVIWMCGRVGAGPRPAAASSPG